MQSFNIGCRTMLSSWLNESLGPRQPIQAYGFGLPRTETAAAAQAGWYRAAEARAWAVAWSRAGREKRAAPGRATC
mgnify:CR=1 FL=1